SAFSLGSRNRGGQAGLSWSPDGRWLASAREHGALQIWDPETGQEMSRVAQGARSVAWSPDGTRIALGLVDDLGLEVRPWDAREERLQGPVLRRPGPVRALSWSPDGRRLAAASFEADSGSPGWKLTVRDETRGETDFRLGQVAG